MAESPLPESRCLSVVRHQKVLLQKVEERGLTPPLIFYSAIASTKPASGRYTEHRTGSQPCTELRGIPLVLSLRTNCLLFCHDDSVSVEQKSRASVDRRRSVVAAASIVRQLAET
ncbi:MAG: hypothetical protein CM15mV106_150 [uncultured marine virus]|nr:MAG: hypothetical protein CM15mV106_150 [uncultured marine virus]